MTFENTNPIETQKPEVLENLDSLGDFSLEKTMCQELLLPLEAHETFVFTSFVENICNKNPEAKQILESGIEK